MNWKRNLKKINIEKSDLNAIAIDNISQQAVNLQILSHVR